MTTPSPRSSTTPKSNKKLSPDTERSFVKVVEGINRPLSTILLKNICDQNPDVFGTPGSSRRRGIQKKFDYLKRKQEVDPTSYLSTLLKLNVPASPITLKMVNEMRARSSTKKILPGSKSPTKQRRLEKKIKTPTDSGALTPLDLNSAFDNLAISPSPTKDTMVNNGSNDAFGAESFSLTSTSGSASSSGTVSGAPENGTHDNPFVIKYNASQTFYAHGKFEIRFLERMEDKTHYRKGFAIRAPDVGFTEYERTNFWHAEIDPQVDNAVLIVTRSYNFFFDYTIEEFCSKGDQFWFIKNSDYAAQLRNKGSYGPQATWYRIVFPKSFGVLDNGLFSGDSKEVKREFVGFSKDFNFCTPNVVTEEQDTTGEEEDNNNVIEGKVIFVSWIIAVQGGLKKGGIIKKKENVKSIFG